MKDGVWAETGIIEDHFSGGMEAQNSRNFLKYMKVIIMKFQHIKGNGITSILLSSNEGSTNEIQLHPIELLVIGIYGSL